MHTTFVDPNQLLACAHRAFINRQFEAARHDLRTILRAYPAAGPALHLLALVEKQDGRIEDAKKWFEATLRAAPQDAEAHNNYANLLDSTGETTSAVHHYSRAVALAPNFANAHISLGLALHTLNRLEEALPVLERAAGLAPQSPRPLTALALLYRDLDRIEEAEATINRALSLAPEDPKSLHTKAALVAERDGGAAALPYFAHARIADPTSHDALLGEAVALHEAGKYDAASTRLSQAVAAQPGWIAGHKALAQLRWRMGEGSRFTASFDEALAVRPNDVSLWTEYLSVLTQAGHHDSVVEKAVAARRAAGSHWSFDLAEAAAESERENTAHATALFGKLESHRSRSVALAWTRHLLRSNAPDHAAEMIEPHARTNFGDALAWAYLGTAWRLLGDRRHEWLANREGLVQALDIDVGDITTLAHRLRALHVTHVHPFDQTLRGGTQTTGTLLRRRNPEILQLRHGLQDGVRRYLARLPAVDTQHPLLRVRRDVFRFTGSWSVRLTNGGFHIQHVHPEGVLSSAFYVALPPRLPNDAPDAGWLTVGAPPDELGLDLPPLATIEPREGRLALFPSYLWHGTRPFSSGERLTVAFDVVVPIS